MDNQVLPKNEPRPGQSDPALNGRIRKWAVKNLVAILIINGLIFLAAGRVDWAWGWVYVALLIGNLVAMMALLIPAHPDLVAERSGLGEGTKKWDLVLAPLMAHGTWICAVVAALDFRFGWSVELGTWPHLTGLVLQTAGLSLLMWAMLSNSFFGPTVRIQSERGHHAVADGPYRFVRHPGYVAITLIYLGTPLLLGFRWAFVVAGVGLIATVVRTALEDSTLRQELPGYEGYCSRTEYRLVPGLW